MSSKTIGHLAKVIETTKEFTTVEFTQQSACATCHAKGMCSLTDESVKILSLPADPWNKYEVGEEVMVEMRQSLGLKAVWLCYLVPLLVFMVVMFTLSKLGLGDLAVGLSSVASVVLYYLILYIIRDKISNEYVFVLKKIK